jgi:hypothetical protein
METFSMSPETRLVPYAATVTYRDRTGRLQEENFPLRVSGEYETAVALAFAYVCKVLRLKEFELRLAGS